MDAVNLTPAEWEWFKHLARKSSAQTVPPADIGCKLVGLRLLEETRGGGLALTMQGLNVLKLVDRQWHRRYRWRTPRG